MRVLAVTLIATLGVCAGAAGAVVGVFIAVSRDLRSESAPIPPRIAAWQERASLALPPGPQPHGPPLSKEELEQYKARTSKQPEEVRRIAIDETTKADTHRGEHLHSPSRKVPPGTIVVEVYRGGVRAEYRVYSGR